jgi:Uma2 family endonuclease
VVTSFAPPAQIALDRIYERAAGGIYSALRTAFDTIGSSGTWWISLAPQLRLGTDSVTPAVAGWRRSRVPAFEATSAIAPDWVCEVVAEDGYGFEKAVKMPLYAKHAVRHVWIVERYGVVESYEMRAGYWTIMFVGGDEAARVEPFETIEIPLQDLWLPNTPAA